ncbi:BZ3500_MvSof-1268-A1-R1_Chr2-1g04300 [Microbotryum saponariae]|uniref:BZ3500_MvSof-1268-A1-R1_Chr2-1g04300 protein n=1 Tax=Microbotryum saponariae TaxID=289078 RepID=A0A2X0MB56_9BASI|nr:BZ3500_MvSof-1268-A1-R1_Chr2-1g04300 [Microbotryum saponariae]SCZ91370.1 BZ3501_MvSof-1269-A2-R1_Chr2-1g03956 [Microbotryum saponariae]
MNAGQQGAPQGGPGYRPYAQDCASTNEIKAREPIRCRECGCRMMYKKRIKRTSIGTASSRVNSETRAKAQRRPLRLQQA